MPNTNSITLDEAVAPVNPAPASSMTLEEAVGGPSHLEVAPSTGQDPDTAGWDTHWYSPITTLPGRIWSAIENRQQQDNSGLIAPPEPMTQQDVSAYKDLFGDDGRQLSGGAQARLENWGFTPQQVTPHWGARFTGTQQQLAQWQKQNAPQNYKSIQNPIKLWVNNSLPANMIHYAFNAPYYEAMKYNAVKNYERANHIVMNAAEYTPQQVKLANVVIKELKNTGPGFLANFKNLYHQIVSHPEQFGVGLVNGITADPELLLSGKIFGGIAEAGLAKLGLGAAEGAAINAGISAGQQLRDTGQVHLGPTAAAGVQGLGIGALTSSFHVKGAEAKPSIKDMPDHTSGQGTPPPATPPPSTPPAGETTPTPESMTLDEAIRGISEGKTPATEGTTAKDAKKAASRSRAKAPASTDRVAQTDSGQPLHPYTPVDTTKNVDLAGGVTKNGRVVISKEIPQTVNVNGVDVDAHDAIALHERTEWPLMHLDKPMTADGIARLRQQIGGRGLTKSIYIKLLHGTPLTYQEAHYVATLAENHYVSVRYGIDPELYQQALKPYIEKARAAAQAEGNTHQDIDEKPNRDSGELDNLRNAQRSIKNDPANDPELQALAQRSNQSNLLGEPENNASGESAASLEAIRRVQDELQSGRARIKIYPDGKVVPLIGVDAIDEVAHPGEIIAQKGLGPDPNDWTILDQGKNVSNNMAKIRLNKAKPSITELESGKIDSGILFHMGLIGAGGVAGALAYRKHPVVGGLAGALAGLALPFAGDGSKGSLLDTLHEGGAVNPNGELSGLMDERGELPNEQNLIEQAKNGDRAAFTKLINRYGPRLVRALWPFERSVSGMDAQDLAQEAFIKAYNNIHDFNGESKFYTWLHRIGMNTAYDAIRSAKREPQIVHPSEYVSTGREGMDPEDQRAHQVQTDMEQIPEGLTNPESIAVSNQTGELIQKAMARLPDKLRLAVDLADFQGFSDQEIADKLGLPRATVATWLNRAHTSIQDYLVSEGNTRAIGPKGQRGAMSVESMKRLALIGGGATLGAYYGHSWKDILGGAVLGGAASIMSVKGTYRAIRGLGNMRPDMSIKSLADTHEGDVGVAYRSLAVLQHSIDKLVPNTEDRVKITHWLDGDKSIQLTPEQLRAAQMAQKFFDYMKQEGLKHKVLKNAIGNYVTHLWGGKNTSPLMDTLFKQNKSDPMSATSRFALRRTFSTLAEGKAAGLTPTTEDISDILGVYGRSMIKAVMNKKFVDALKDAKTPDGKSLLMSSTKAPTNYVRINHPQLSKVSVHPGIEPELRFLFEADNPNDMLTALEGVNTATKRMNVSFSLFHGKSLFDAAMASGWNPIKTIKMVAQSAAGRSIFNKMILEGKSGDLVDTAIRAGLRFQFKRGTGVDPDVQEGFYPMLESLQRFAERTVPGAGKVPEGLIKVNRAADKVLWENLHAGLKLSVFSKTLETLKENWAKERMRNPDEKVPTDDELAASAASYTNDLFGGLNWRRVAEDARTEIGRRLKMGMLSPTGRKALELAMFAPDWKIATFRAFYKALGEGSGWKGLIHPKTLADLHRGYILRSAIYYLATGDAINYHFSGHHIWQNKDPTMIDLGDGRKMQWSKHAMEGPDWVLKPRSQMLNSLGVIPKQGLEQALDVRWLSPEGNAPKIRDRLGHLVSSVLPISAASYSESGGAGAISSFLGAPIYGRKALTKQQKAYKAEQTRRLHELSKFQ